MLSAIDTNIISALWSKESASVGIAKQLFECSNQGGLVIAAPVYAELLAYPKATKAFVDEFLSTTKIQVDYKLSEEIWHLAAQSFADYAERRRKMDDEGKRLLVDFIVGAHAQLNCNALLSLDKRRYATSFPKLKLL